MRKHIAICLVIVLAVVLGGAAANAYRQLQTVHARYYLLRAEADEDSTLVTLATAGDYANKPAGAVYVDPDTNAIQIIIAGGDTANETFSWKLYAWRKMNGPAEYMANGTGVLGTQQVVTCPDTGLTSTGKYWADTLVVSSEEWIASVNVIDAGGDNRVAKIVVDLCGYEWVYLEITDANGATTEAGDISAYYSYY